MARVLSNCDLCGPPLKPIVLDNEDWDNLCVWFTHIWPTTSKGEFSVRLYTTHYNTRRLHRNFIQLCGSIKIRYFPLLDSKAISPDDFHWHCHAGRAMGHMVDLQNNTFSNGKILLGSYMKKPVQVDLKAVTVSDFVCEYHKEYFIRSDLLSISYRNFLCLFFFPSRCLTQHRVVFVWKLMVSRKFTTRARHL